MKFSDIPGHENVKRRLRDMVEDNRRPHALLLAGPAGIGKMAIARAFVQYIHCANPTLDGDSCGRCPSCIQHQSFNHIDTFYSYPVVKPEGKTEGAVSADYISEWRDYLDHRVFMNLNKWTSMFTKKNAQPCHYVTESASIVKWLSTTGHASKCKAIIMWLPERMNDDTANKLLKLVEEPLGDAMIVFVSDDPENILPTIYSRCQTVEMSRYPDQTVADYLRDKYPELTANDAAALAHIADGSLGTALSLAEDEGDKTYFELFKQLMRLAYQRKVSELKKWSETVTALGREAEIKFYDYCQRLIRENFIYNFGRPEIQYLTSEEASFSANFARFINENNAVELSGLFDDAIRDIAGNGNGKIVNFDVAISVILLLKRQ